MFGQLWRPLWPRRFRPLRRLRLLISMRRLVPPWPLPRRQHRPPPPFRPPHSRLHRRLTFRQRSRQLLQKPQQPTRPQRQPWCQLQPPRQRRPKPLRRPPLPSLPRLPHPYQLPRPRRPRYQPLQHRYPRRLSHRSPLLEMTWLSAYPPFARLSSTTVT